MLLGYFLLWCKLLELAFRLLLFVKKLLQKFQFLVFSTPCLGNTSNSIQFELEKEEEDGQ